MTEMADLWFWVRDIEDGDGFVIFMSDPILEPRTPEASDYHLLRTDDQ